MALEASRRFEQLNIYPNVYHINEGHAAFLTLERLKELLHLGLPFHVAVETVRSATVFTTHTPVPAGHDTFSIEMVEHYLGPLLSELSRHKQDIVALRARSPYGSIQYDPFGHEYGWTAQWGQ